VLWAEAISPGRCKSLFVERAKFNLAADSGPSLIVRLHHTQVFYDECMTGKAADDICSLKYWYDNCSSKYRNQSDNQESAVNALKSCYGEFIRNVGPHCYN
jgi:hypothetical protein